MEYDKMLNRFSYLLEQRLRKNIFTTEDAVRYTFFAALMDTTDLQPDNVIPEYPHPARPKAEIDTWLTDASGGGNTAFEFKYDRAIPSGLNTNVTQKSGKLFCDFQRLALIPLESNASRFCVYLASQAMSGYWSNNFRDFWSLNVSESLALNPAYLAKKPETFKAQLIGNQSFSATITLRYSSSLPEQHELRVYEITTVNDESK